MVDQVAVETGIAAAIENLATIAAEAVATVMDMATPFEFRWKPFEGPRGDEIELIVRANTPETLMNQVKAMLKVMGPVLRSEYKYEWRGEVAKTQGSVLTRPVTPPTPDGSAPKTGAEEGSDGSHRRHGKKNGGTESSESGKADEGQFPIKVMKVVKSDKLGRNMLVIEPKNSSDPTVFDTLPAGPKAWAKNFPDDWSADDFTPGEIYNAASDDPMICIWKRKGEYINVKSVTYA